jgi:hypothetical protein
VISGTRAYVVDAEAGVAVFDLAAGADPALLGDFTTRAEAKGVAVADGVLYVAADALYVMDAAATPPKPIGAVSSTPGAAVDVAVVGDRAFVADGIGGVRVFDLDAPGGPALAEIVGVPGKASSIATDGTYLYVAAGAEGGLRVLDPAASGTKEIGGVTTPDAAWAVAVAAPYAYVAVQTAGVSVFDVSDPTAPALVRQVDTPGIARDIVIDGALGYVVNGIGLQILDLTSPSNPALLGAVDIGAGSPGAVAVSGTFVFLTSINVTVSTVLVIDASDPAFPVVKTTLPVAGRVKAVARSGNWLFVTSDPGRVTLFDITDPAVPVERGTTTILGTGGGLTSRGDRLVIADGANPLSIVTVGCVP